MKIAAIITAFLLTTAMLPAQELAFQSGEKLVYTITYQATLWPKTDMGRVTLSVNDGELESLDSFRIKARATTSTFFSIFYKLDDTFETWIDKSTMLPVKFACEKSEGKYRFSSSYSYDWNRMEVATVWRNHKRGGDNVNTLPLTSLSMDPMAHYYTLRSKDIASWELGHEYVIDLVMDDKIKTVKYRYLGEEKKNFAGYGSVSSLKMACQLANPDEMMDGGKEFYVWLSNDPNKIPLLIETPTKVGNVKVRLTSFNGLKHPDKSAL